MSGAAWALAAVLALLLAALLCPVRYHLYIGRDGGAAEVRFFGGLYTKRVRWPEEEEDAEASAASGMKEDGEAAPAPVEKERPLVLDRDGRPAARDGADEASAAGAKEEDVPADETPPATETRRPSTLAVLSFAWENGTLRILLCAAGRLYRHSRPRHLVLAGRAGLGDPMKTGVAAGLVYAAFPGACRIAWDFTGAVFDVCAEARGRVVPLYVLYIIGGVLAAGPVRRTRAFRSGRPVSVSPRGAEEARNGRRREKETV